MNIEDKIEEEYMRITSMSDEKVAEQYAQLVNSYNELSRILDAPHEISFDLYEKTSIHTRLIRRLEYYFVSKFMTEYGFSLDAKSEKLCDWRKDND